MNLKIYYLFFSFILHLTYTYRLSIIVFLWIHNRVASDSGDRWGFVFFVFVNYQPRFPFYILQSMCVLTLNVRNLIKISVIKLMSFNTLALPKKLRDAFNREKKTLQSLSFFRYNFHKFCVIFNFEEKKKYTQESSKCRIKRKLHMRIYTPYHEWSVPQGEFLLLSKSKQPLFLLLCTKHTPGPCFHHYPKNF